jgi:hypothetical protein
MDAEGPAAPPVSVSILSLIKNPHDGFTAQSHEAFRPLQPQVCAGVFQNVTWRLLEVEL